MARLPAKQQNECGRTNPTVMGSNRSDRLPNVVFVTVQGYSRFFFFFVEIMCLISPNLDFAMIDKDAMHGARCVLNYDHFSAGLGA